MIHLSSRQAVDNALGLHLLDAFEGITQAPGMDAFLARPRGNRLFWSDSESPKAFRQKLGRTGLADLKLPVLTLHRIPGHSIENQMDVIVNDSQSILLSGENEAPAIEASMGIVINPVILEYRVQMFSNTLAGIDSLVALLQAHFLKTHYFPVPYLIDIPASAGVHAGATYEIFSHSEIKDYKELMFEDVSPQQDRQTYFGLGASVSLRVQTADLIGQGVTPRPLTRIVLNRPVFAEPT